MNEHQPLTRYIKHLADSADIKGGTFNKLCNCLIGNLFEMPNVSYTNPLGTSEQNTTPMENLLHKDKKENKEKAPRCRRFVIGGLLGKSKKNR